MPEFCPEQNGNTGKMFRKKNDTICNRGILLVLQYHVTSLTVMLPYCKYKIFIRFFFFNF